MHLRGRREAGPAPLRQPFGRDGGRRRPRDGQQHDHGVLPPGLQPHLGRGRLRAGDDGDVQRARFQAAHGLGRANGLQPQLDVGVLRMEPLQHQRQQLRAHARRHGHPHHARPASRTAAHAIHQIIASGQQLAPVLHQHGAGRRELCQASAADDQRRVQPAFQLLHVQADGGRRQVQRLRSGSEGAQIGNGDQGAQLVQVQLTHQQ